jgi:uncharacterized protein (TIGR02757 family)
VNKQQLKMQRVLERLYAKYDHRDLIEPDPLQFVYHYTASADMEVAAFLSAALAYGRVEQIQKSLTELLGRMGESPYSFVRNFNEVRRKKIISFKHRFTTGQDIADLLVLLKHVLRQDGSIQGFFLKGYSVIDDNVIGALSRFCDSLCVIHARGNGGQVSAGLKYLLASPARGSASKRLNLFLRWMVRDDEVDTGLWKSVDKAKLIVPVDVHIGRLSKILGFHNGQAVSLSTALKITQGFARIEPNDPAKYDFSLSRIGIVEDCTGKYRPECVACDLFEFCGFKHTKGQLNEAVSMNLM